MRDRELSIGHWLIPATLASLGAMAMCGIVLRPFDLAIRGFGAPAAGGLLAALVVARAAPARARLAPPLGGLCAVGVLYAVYVFADRAYLLSYDTMGLAGAAGLTVAGAVAGTRASRWWSAASDSTAVWVALAFAHAVGTLFLALALAFAFSPSRGLMVLATLAALPISTCLLQAIGPRYLMWPLAFGSAAFFPMALFSTGTGDAPGVGLVVFAVVILVAVAVGLSALGAHIGWRLFARHHVVADPADPLPAAQLR